MSYEFHDTIDSRNSGSDGSSSNDDSGSPDDSGGSNDPGSDFGEELGAGQRTGGGGGSPSDSGSSDDSGSPDDSDSSRTRTISTGYEPDDSSSDSGAPDTSSVTRDRGGAGAGGGDEPTVGLDDIGGNFTVTGTTDETQQNPNPGSDIVGDGFAEESLDNIGITLPGSSVGDSGSSSLIMIAVVAVLAIGALVLGREL